MTFAAPRATIWCTTNVDNSSSRCASSTPMTTPTPEGAAVSDSTTPRNNATLSVTPDGAHAANAPSGMDLADDAPTVHRVSLPCDAATDNASRAMRLFPTPAAPQTTIPPTSGAEIAASMARISALRPVSGHDRRTQ